MGRNYGAVVRYTTRFARRAKATTKQSHQPWPPRLGGFHEIVAEEDAPEWYSANKDR